MTAVKKLFRIDGIYAGRKGKAVSFAFGILSAFPFISEKFFLFSWLFMAPALYPCVKFSVGKKDSAGYMFAYGFGLSMTALIWIPSIYPLEFLGFGKIEAAFVSALMYLALSALSAAKAEADNDTASINNNFFI